MSLNEVVNNPAKYGQPARDIPQLTYDMRQRGVDYGVRDLTFGMSSETYNELSPQLDDIVIDATTRFIFGEITEDEYDAEMQRWLDSGGADVLAEYQAQYDG
jgi:putative aldouronate transport system substrate-binding protein